MSQEDRNWPRASAWLAGGDGEATLGRLAVLGAPLRLGSITPGRCDLAPEAIRLALARFSTGDIETGLDLRLIEARDLGDLPLAEARPEEALAPLSEAVDAAIEEAGAVVILGGDNSVTRPALHGLPAALSRCGLLTFDAHFDLRDLDRGLSNGNPVRALLRDGLPGENIVQIGIQPFANSMAYARVAREAGIFVVTADEAVARGIEEVTEVALAHLASRAEAIYVDLDLDVLDRAFAPGTPGSRPGGLLARELRRAARRCGYHPLVRAIDLVELDPTLDLSDATQLTAAACLLSFAAGLLSRLAENE